MLKVDIRFNLKRLNTNVPITVKKLTINNFILKVYVEYFPSMAVEFIYKKESSLPAVNFIIDEYEFPDFHKI